MMSYRLSIKLFVLFSVFAMSSMFLSACASSEEKEENWGVELPLPQGITGPIGIYNIYYNKKNEIVIPYYFSNKEKRFTRYYNFSTNTLEHECQGNKEERRECNMKITQNLEEVDFQLDKFTISGLNIESINDGNCSYPLSNSINIEDNNGGITTKKIIRLYKNKEVFTISSDCSLSSGKEKHFIHLESLLFNFFVLKDGTLLGNAFEKPIMVRFKKDMTSPYFKDNKNYLLVEGAKLDDIYHQCLGKIDGMETNLSEIEAVDSCVGKILLQ